MLNFSFEVAGDKQIARAFDFVIQGTENFSPVFKTIGRRFQTYEQKLFASEGAIAGQKWEPLSPAYRKWKAAHYGSQPILVLTGKMQKSLTTSKAVLEIHHLMALYGTTVPYAIYHQLGTDKMPARPPVKLSQAEKWAWTKEVHQYIIKLIESRGLKV